MITNSPAISPAMQNEIIKKIFKEMQIPLAKKDPFDFGFSALSQYGYSMGNFPTMAEAEQFTLKYYRGNMKLILQ